MRCATTRAHLIPVRCFAGGRGAAAAVAAVAVAVGVAVGEAAALTEDMSKAAEEKGQVAAEAIGIYKRGVSAFRARGKSTSSAVRSWCARFA